MKIRPVGAKLFHADGWTDRHDQDMLIKRSNLMQQCADIYLLQSHSTCFGCHSAHHLEH